MILEKRIICHGNSSMPVVPCAGHLPEKDKKFNVGPWMRHEEQLEKAHEFCSYVDNNGRLGQAPLRTYHKRNKVYYRLGWGHNLVAQYEVQNNTAFDSNGCVPWTTIDVATCMKVSGRYLTGKTNLPIVSYSSAFTD